MEKQSYKLLIWGTGNYAEKFIENRYNGEIIGFIETNKSKESFMGKPIYDSHNIPENYDFIIVANSYATEIYNLCIQLKIDCSRMVFLYPVKNRMGFSDLQILKDILMEKNYVGYCVQYGISDYTFINEDAKTYRKLNKRPRFDIQEKYMWPIIKDKYGNAGATGTYFWQDLWAAKKIIKSGIKRHFDIGSRLDGFIAHLLAADIDVTMIDVRKFPGEIEHLNTIVDDATSLHQIEDESIESISALCSLEHFGLGRYGDAVDPEACFKCFSNIQKKLKKGGRLYISLPIGMERVEFNAHRIFYASTVVECFSSLELKEFSCTTDDKIERNVEIHKYDNDSHNGIYRFGLFYFEK